MSFISPLGKQHLKNDENVCFIEPETGNVLPDKSTKPGGSVVYVADAGKFAYHMDSTLYGDWYVAGVPPAGMFMNADRTASLPDKLYLLGDAVYTGTEGRLRLLAYRHEVMSGERCV